MTSPLTIDHIAQQVLKADERIRPKIRKTYLTNSPYFSQLTGANVAFKCENLQLTGSFKVRGALNKIYSLSPAERDNGVVTASSGNHGAGVAYAMSQFGKSALVVVPTVADREKVAKIEQLGASVIVHGEDGVESEDFGREYAGANGLTYISPYNDIDVMAGQGTIGIEINQQWPEIDSVLISVGGGGLISGISAYLKSVNPIIEIIGCQPENSQVMKLSVEANEILDAPSLDTLSDGTAGGVEVGSITFPICRDHVDSFVTVTEQEIAASLQAFIKDQKMLIEGSAAVPLAVLLKNKPQFAGKNVVILLCGANIGLKTLQKVLTLVVPKN